MREVSLPSGSVLSVAAAPFAVAKALHQAVLREVKGISFKGTDDSLSFIKEFVCAGLSSQEVDKALTECLKRCLYNGLKIDADTFEPIEARQDYIPVVLEVVQDNIGPFVRSLFAGFAQFASIAQDTPTSK